MLILPRTQAECLQVLRISNLIVFSQIAPTPKPTYDGYDILYGGDLFQCRNGRPRRKLTVLISGKAHTSNAGGRCELIKRYFDAYQVSIRMADGVNPKNRDLLALQQVHERCALDCIETGRIQQANAKCSNTWVRYLGNACGTSLHRLEKLLGRSSELRGTLA